MQKKAYKLTEKTYAFVDINHIQITVVVIQDLPTHLKSTDLGSAH